MSDTRKYLDLHAAWSRLDTETQAAVGVLVLKIAVCRARRTHAERTGADARAARIAETLLHDQLYALTRDALPDVVASHAAVKLLTIPGLVTPACPGHDPRRDETRPRKLWHGAPAPNDPDERQRP